MKTLLALALLIVIPSCALTKSAQPIVRDCALQVTPVIASDVAEALGGVDYEALLTKEVTAYGLCVVRDAVRAFESGNAKASANPAAKARASSWLASHPG